MKVVDPDILHIQEIKTQDEKVLPLAKLIPSEYAQYWNWCNEKKGYSGTALFTKLQPKEVTFGLGIKEHDQQGRAITAEFDDFILVGTYVPNAGEGLKRLSYRTEEWDKAI